MVSFTCPSTSYKCNHLLCILLCLAYFPQHNVYTIYACCFANISLFLGSKQSHDHTVVQSYGKAKQRASAQNCCPQQESPLLYLGTLQYVGTTQSSYNPGDPQTTLSTPGSPPHFLTWAPLSWAWPWGWGTSNISDFGLCCL